LEDFTKSNDTHDRKFEVDDEEKNIGSETSGSNFLMDAIMICKLYMEFTNLLPSKVFREWKICNI